MNTYVVIFISVLIIGIIIVLFYNEIINKNRKNMNKKKISDAELSLDEKKKGEQMIEYRRLTYHLNLGSWFLRSYFRINLIFRQKSLTRIEKI